MTQSARISGRVLAAALICMTLLVTLVLTAAPAAARDDAYRDGFCSIDWRQGRRQIKRLIRCAQRRWHVPGGASKAICIARRESGLKPRAYNRAGYAGLFQQSTRYWPRRARSYGFPDWSAFNGRANTIVSIRMAHRGGWGPWSTSGGC
jgi:hypothetical protein